MKVELNKKDVKAIKMACFYAVALLRKENENNKRNKVLSKWGKEDIDEINRIWAFFRSVKND